MKGYIEYYDKTKRTMVEKDFETVEEAHEYAEKLFDDDMDLSRIPKVYPVAECSCGAEVVCFSFTNTCDCGRDYNFSGQLLEDRSQWGEETGENWQDCY